MNATINHLRQVATEMRVTSKGTGFEYQWGESGRAISWNTSGRHKGIWGNLTFEDQRWTMMKALGAAIYDIYFQGARSSPWLGEQLWNLDVRIGWVADASFLAVLDESNHGQGYFEPGWRVAAACEHKLTVKRGQLTLHIDRPRHLRAEEQLADVGDEVAIRFPKSWPIYGPGQYVAFGDVYWRPEAGECLRLYFQVDPRGAPALIQALTTLLNTQQLPFHLKVLSNPSVYQWRRDCAVLYTHPSDFIAVRDTVEAVYPRLAHWFKPEVPAFCKLIHPGLALAEDPKPASQGIESFGQNRSRLVAEGLAAASEESGKGMKHRFNHIVTRLEKEGLRLSHPWLNPGSNTDYEWN